MTAVPSLVAGATNDLTGEPDDVFAARVAVFDNAPTPPEILREQVIDALYGVCYPDGEPKLHMARKHVGDLADAAVAVFAAQPHPAVHNCPMCESTTGHWHGCGYGLRAAAAGDSDA